MDRFTLCLVVLCFTMQEPSPAEDGFTSGDVFTSDGKVTGRHLSLTTDGKTVYTRTYPAKSNPEQSSDKPYVESLLIEGEPVLQLYHQAGAVRISISGSEKYSVSIDYSKKDRAIETITIVPKQALLEYVWKPDEKGFFSDFHWRSTDIQRF